VRSIETSAADFLPASLAAHARLAAMPRGLGALAAFDFAITAWHKPVCGTPSTWAAPF
jgi:hypothetical protein